MCAAIQRQDQLFQVMQTNQNETLRLIREMQQENRDYAIRNEDQYTEIATELHDLNIRVNGSPSDRRRRVRTRGASSYRNRNTEEWLACIEDTASFKSGGVVLLALVLFPFSLFPF